MELESRLFLLLLLILVQCTENFQITGNQSSSKWSLWQLLKLLKNYRNFHQWKYLIVCRSHTNMKTENGAQCLTKRNYVLLYCDVVVKLLIPKIWYNWIGSFSSQPKLAVWLFHLPLHFQAKIIQAPQRAYCQL